MVSTCSIEINATFDSLHITFSIPVGLKTSIIKTSEACYEITSLAKWRVVGRVAVSIIRLVLAGFMVVEGSAPFSSHPRTRAPALSL